MTWSLELGPHETLAQSLWRPCESIVMSLRFRCGYLMISFCIQGGFRCYANMVALSTILLLSDPMRVAMSCDWVPYLNKMQQNTCKIRGFLRILTLQAEVNIHLNRVQDRSGGSFFQ